MKKYQKPELNIETLIQDAKLASIEDGLYEKEYAQDVSAANNAGGWWDYAE